MNVVMPTATSSMHTDPALSAASTKTAERGLTVLKSLLDNKVMKENCKAIYAAATSTGKQDADDELVKVRQQKETSNRYPFLDYTPNNLCQTIVHLYVVLDQVFCELWI